MMLVFLRRLGVEFRNSFKEVPEYLPTYTYLILPTLKKEYTIDYFPKIM